jgi:hypothetical protein
MSDNLFNWISANLVRVVLKASLIAMTLCIERPDSKHESNSRFHLSRANSNSHAYAGAYCLVEVRLNLSRSLEHTQSLHR